MIVQEQGNKSSSNVEVNDVIGLLYILKAIGISDGDLLG